MTLSSTFSAAVPCLCALVLTMLSGFSAEDQDSTAARVWTNDKGQQIEAQLVALDEKIATIRREDGVAFAIPISALSLNDQQYLKSQQDNFSWTTVKAFDIASEDYSNALDFELSNDRVIRARKILGRSRSDSETIELREAAPKTYRERIFQLIPRAPHSIAVTNEGKVAMLSDSRDWKDQITMVAADGTLSVLYKKQKEDSDGIDQPWFDRNSRIGTMGRGNFTFYTRWKENLGPNTWRSPAAIYQIAGDRVPSIPKAFTHSLSHGVGLLQKFDSQGDDQLTILFGGLVCIATPAQLRTVDSMLGIQRRQQYGIPKSPIVALSETTYLVEGATLPGDGVAILLDLTKATWAVVGQERYRTRPRNETQTNPGIHTATTSPNGKWTIHYNRKRKALMHLEIEGIHY